MSSTYLNNLGEMVAITNPMLKLSDRVRALETTGLPETDQDLVADLVVDRVNKTSIGLSEVENLAPDAMPVSTAQAAALADKLTTSTALATVLGQNYPTPFDEVRTLGDKLYETKTSLDFGAKADNSTDNAAAFVKMATWLTGAASGRHVIMLPGVFRTSQPWILVGSYFSIQPLTPGTTVIRYTGADTTVDIVKIGSSAGSNGMVFLGDITIDTTTNMTAGCAVHCERLNHSLIEAQVVGQSRYNPADNKMFHGIWFDKVDNVTCSSREIFGKGDGIRVNGTVGAGFKADLKITGHPKISGFENALHCGGGFGGLYVPGGNFIVNKTSVRVSTDLCAEGNRELFFGSELALDSSLETNVEIVDALAGIATYITFDSPWIASSVSGYDNILVDGYVGILMLNGGTVFKAGRDGLRVNSTATVLVNGTLFRENVGWGVNPTNSSNKVRLVNPVFTLNTGGDVSDTKCVGTHVDANRNQAVGTLVGQYGPSGFPVPRQRVSGYADMQAGTSYQAWVNSNRGGVTVFTKSRGATEGSYTIVQSGDEIARMIFAGADGAALQRAAQIIVSVDATPGAGSMPGRIAISTCSSGSNTPTERLVIDSAGNIIMAGLRQFANDAAAAAASPAVPLNGLYINNSTKVLQARLV